MMTEEEKKQLLDDIEKVQYQKHLEELADMTARMQVFIGVSDTYVKVKKEMMEEGKTTDFSREKKKRLKMLIDSPEAAYYEEYFPEEIEHLKSNYKKLEELEKEEFKKIEEEKERRGEGLNAPNCLGGGGYSDEEQEADC